MTGLTDTIERAGATARSMLNETGELHPLAIFYRDDDVVAQLVLDGDGVDQAESAGMAATFFAADVVVLTSESWHSKLRENPITGKPWERGEQGRAVAEADALAKGWVSEAIVTTAVDRSGDVVVTLQPYTRAGGEVVWGDVEDMTTKGKITGAIPTILHDAMAQQPLTIEYAVQSEPEMAALAAGMSEEAQRARMDCAAVKVMLSTLPIVGVMLTAAPGTVRAAEIADSFGKGEGDD